MAPVESLKHILNQLPEEPGVYKYFNDLGQIIYVGKAKNLKKRVQSYFSKQHDEQKTRVLVSKIRDIQYTVVDTEFEALLLENTLIKEYQPRYNINLKDDKSYPYIKITKEAYPRVIPVRQRIKDGSEYIGPYASVKMMHTILELTQKLYPTRNCTLNLNADNISKGKFKLCLEYQIGNCKGPCEDLQTQVQYLDAIAQIRHILKGNLQEVRQHLKAEMQAAVDTLAFEEAQKIKNKLELLSLYQSKSTVVNTTISKLDVFAMVTDNRAAYVNGMRIVDGMVVQSQTFEIKKNDQANDEELLLQGIAQFVNTHGMSAKEWLLPFEIKSIELAVPYAIPQSGDRKKLLELSYKNAFVIQREKQLAAEKLDPDLKVDRLLSVMQKDLKLSAPPKHIECFDNSNIQGTHPVSACVVFKNGKASKKDYRHFNIKTVEGPNDFASMIEVLTRRYTRMVQEQQLLPDLVVVDGGKGQLSSAVEAFKAMGLYGKVPIIGIAKRLEELYYPNDPLPLYLDKRSETLKVIQQMRDEAHRFGITHHRNRRSKNFTQSELLTIEGVGEKTAMDLLRHFKSISKLKKASLEELKQQVNQTVALNIFNYFNEA